MLADFEIRISAPLKATPLVKMQQKYLFVRYCSHLRRQTDLIHWRYTKTMRFRKNILKQQLISA